MSKVINRQRAFHRSNTPMGRNHKAFAESGLRFGKLVCVRVVEHRGRNHVLCRCDCGAEKPYGRHDLVYGKVVSCGCMQEARRKEVGKKIRRHGHTINGKRSSTYVIWTDMIQRCDNKACEGYKDYGARGITVCESWHKFENFLSDMGVRPNGLTLDRIDNNGNYEKSNCRWVSYTRQANNRRNTSFIEYGGVRMSAADWSRKLGIPRVTIKGRIRKGFSVPEALSTVRLPARHPKAV